MKYTEEQRRRAKVTAYVIDERYFDYFDRCYKAKNGVYWYYDQEDLRMKPISIGQLAHYYEYYLQKSEPEVLQEAEERMKQEDLL